MKTTLLASCIFFALTSTGSWANANQTYDDPPDEFEDEFSDESFDYYGGEEFISIATGTKKAISKAPSIAEVITSDDIKVIGANNFHQILEHVTGLHVYPSNFNRMNPSYSIRGIHTRQNTQVLLLVNGVRTTSNWVGAKWDG
ncbi:MAG: TonB-dependent receptor plug domain-containing protein [Aestuariibacter sp.]